MFALLVMSVEGTNINRVECRGRYNDVYTR